MMSADLWWIAQAVAAGEPGSLDVTGWGGNVTRPRVTVRWTWVDDEGEATKEWKGPLTDWCAALAEATAREPFPGTIPGWRPGPYEAAARAETEVA